MKNNFKTPWSFTMPVCPSGDGRELEYRYVNHDNKSKVLECVGSINFYDGIQVDRFSCDVNELMKKYQNDGDISIFDKRDGFYADISKLPKSMQEFHNNLDAVKDSFYSMPVDFKSLFNNDYMTFVNSVRTGSYDEIIRGKYGDRVDSSVNNTICNSSEPIKKEVVNDSQ